MLTHRNLAELDLPDEILACLPLLSSDILGYDVDLDLANFVDDLLDVVVQEPIKRRNLLRNQAVLREVGPDDRPSVILVDVIVGHPRVNRCCIGMLLLQVPLGRTRWILFDMRVTLDHIVHILSLVHLNLRNSF